MLAERLPKERAAELSRHAAGCPDCGAFKAELARLVAGLELEPGETADAGFARDVMAKVREGEAQGRFVDWAGTVRRLVGSRWRFAFGMLAVLSVAVEAVTHGTADALYDPFPTLGHLAVCLAATIAALFVERQLGWPVPRRPRLLAFTSAFVLGVGLAYTVGFLPLIPVFLIAIVAMGLGILGLGPVVLMATAVSQLVALRRRSPLQVRLKPYALAGWALAVGTLVALQAPIVVTSLAASAATSGHDPDKHASALSVLRRFADPVALRNVVYNRSPLWDPKLSPEQGAVLFYRATGGDIDSPQAQRWHDGLWHLGAQQRRWEGSWSGDWEAREFDRPMSARGLAHGLFLSGSAIDGVVSAEAPVAYVEWTMTLANAAAWQQEATAQLVLPSGGVGSRLTLWINGEEREAAYAATSKVREAYQAVVSQRRDPALLTWVAPDRLQLRAFPIPAGGSMRLKVGVTVPLVERDGEWLMQLPWFAERNFVIGPSLEHAVWVEAPQPLTGPAFLRREPGAKGGTVLRGTLPSRELAQMGTRALVRVHPERAFPTEFVVNLAKGFPLVARMEAPPLPRPYPLVLVVDGSAGMRAQEIHWATALIGLPAGSEVRAILAVDKPEEWTSDWVAATPAALGQLDAWLRQASYSGGHDPVRALERAIDLAASRPGGRVIWVHAPNPTLVSQPVVLEQAIARRPDGPRIYSLETRLGPERILEGEVGRSGMLVPVPRFGDVTADLLRLARHGDLGQPVWRIARAEQPPTGVPVGADHVARFVVARWAEDLARHGKAEERADALDEAARLRLITPFTGAVVLESKAQYARAGLTPAKSDTVPAVPEPATIGLVAVAGASLVAAWRRRRREARC
jgi:hypothetical protein